MLVTEATLEQAIDTLRQYRQLAVDLETTGLDVYPIDTLSGGGDILCGIAVCGGSDAFYFPFRHGEGYNLPYRAMDALRSLFVSRNCTFWNAKFDLKFLYKDGFPPLVDVEDVMLAAHLMSENEKNYKLKDLGTKYITPDAAQEQDALAEALAERGWGKGDMWKLSSETVAPYAEQDVLLTQQLRKFYEKHLIAFQLYELWIELNEYLQCILTMEMRGFLLDTDYIRDTMDVNLSRKEQISEQLEQMAGHVINPNSPKQVNALLERTGSTAVDILETLDHPAAQLIIDFRRCTKANGTYYSKFLEYSVDGILHPNLFMVGTVTGRFSCFSPNLMALPRKSDAISDPRNAVKGALIARNGYSLVQVDYKQAEVYLGAHYANAAALLQMIKDGVDVHQVTADMVGISRDAAKRMNFAMQYGISAKGLASDLKVSVSRATKYLKQYKTVHPEMADLYFDAERTAHKLNHIQLFTGRMRRYGHHLRSPHRKASNNLIQGGVAELMRIASTEVYRALGGHAHQMMHVHDSIMFEITDTDLQWVIPAICDIMTNFDRYNFKVNFQVSVEVGKRWSELQPWK